ncbi:hypothetical protein L484_022658 [Morus notabilis]|uniref:Uncharacterized protein n=1 Tax=Morus notabilis TaxID=981085 RepID=W9RKT5_9ROSA|nr:hypothetical protein L484_022658 [Morus notabilis]
MNKQTDLSINGAVNPELDLVVDSPLPSVPVSLDEGKRCGTHLHKSCRVVPGPSARCAAIRACFSRAHRDHWLH